MQSHYLILTTLHPRAKSAPNNYLEPEGASWEPLNGTLCFSNKRM